MEIHKVTGGGDFFHGTHLDAVRSIHRHGFRIWAECDGERYARGGNLGNGIYVSRDWRTALFFGPALLRVTVQPGTRLVDASRAPDVRVVDSLQREFGREILTRPPWQVLPANKTLTRRETITLLRYHYQRAWPARGGSDARHLDLLYRFRSLLIRHRFDGYGNPADDNGIVLFAGHPLTLEELVTDLPWELHAQCLHQEFREVRDLEALRRLFAENGSPGALGLAARIVRRRQRATSESR